jgi:hypothetical protein
VSQFGEQVAILVRFVGSAAIARHTWNVAQGSVDVRRRRAECGRSLSCRFGRGLRRGVPDQ